MLKGTRNFSASGSNITATNNNPMKNKTACDVNIRPVQVSIFYYKETIKYQLILSEFFLYPVIEADEFAATEKKQSQQHDKISSCPFDTVIGDEETAMLC